MQHTIEMHSDALASISLRGPLIHANAFSVLERPIRVLREKGMAALLLNCEGLTWVNSAGMAGLIEFLLAERNIKVCAFALPGKLRKKIDRLGLLQALPIETDKKSALANKDVRSVCLCHTPVVVLCGQDECPISPLAQSINPTMLDILGKPALVHTLDQLQGVGVRNVFLNPGHDAPRIHQYFRGHPRNEQSIFYCNEGAHSASGWAPAPIGSASALVRLHRQHTAFSGDFLVIDGSTLCDVDFASAVKAHKKSGASVTVISVTDNSSNSVNVAGYVMSNDVLDVLPALHDQSVAQHLIPFVQRAGMEIGSFQQQGTFRRISTADHYFAAVRDALTNGFLRSSPLAREVKPGVWVDETAKIAANAKISGPCYVGPGAVIEPKASVVGPSSICAGSVLAKGATISKSIVLPGTLVAENTHISGKITHEDWAFDHQPEIQPQNLTTTQNIIRLDSNAQPIGMTA